VNWPPDRSVIAICGGVGGAKLALGLSRILSPEQLTIVVNTGDDFEHLGLTVCPDLDTVTYTLAGINNPETGWGRRGESWNCLDTLEKLGAESWFRLGDRDLAVHLLRRELLARGKSLSEVTSLIAARLGVVHRIVPMSDDAVRTQVETGEGPLAFQNYFVRERCRPEVTGFRFEGAANASLSPGFTRALDNPNLAAILICPSNPFVSVAPVLALPGVADRLAQSPAPVIAVSPIVANSAIKGPAAKMMTELGLELSARGVFDYYGDLLDGFVVDELDSALVNGFPEPDRIYCCNTVMESLQDRIVLAEHCLRFSSALNDLD